MNASAGHPVLTTVRFRQDGTVLTMYTDVESCMTSSVMSLPAGGIASCMADPAANEEVLQEQEVLEGLLLYWLVELE